MDGWIWMDGQPKSVLLMIAWYCVSFLIACGVCSSTQDFWARIKTLDTLETDSVICATSFTLSRAADRFETLIGCYTELGFTDSCATLWAHLSAAISIQCSAFCIPDGTTGLVLVNGPSPTCELAACLTCTEAFQADFYAIAGRILYNSGITERIARPCDVFHSVEHDPCVGTTENGHVGAVGPTMAPDGAIRNLPVMALALVAVLSTVGLMIVGAEDLI
jgi:hypothetical protein